MRDQSTFSAAPDFTKACIVMFGVNITWIFMVVWAVWGLVVVVLLGAIINHMIVRISAHANARADQMRRAPRARARS